MLGLEKRKEQKEEKRLQDKYEELYYAAENARKNAYAPYSDFNVGAALLVRFNEDSPIPLNKKYYGVNIENGSYGATLCAERAAFASAISAGVLNYDSGENPFIAIAVSAGDKDEAIPCGICRQFMYEFNPDLDIITKTDGEIKVRKLRELMPVGFVLEGPAPVEEGEKKDPLPPEGQDEEAAEPEEEEDTEE